jgi:hypothetical protein
LSTNTIAAWRQSPITRCRGFSSPGSTSAIGRATSRPT